MPTESVRVVLIAGTESWPRVLIYVLACGPAGPCASQDAELVLDTSTGRTPFRGAWRVRPLENSATRQRASGPWLVLIFAKA
jgi:hypothetical protein